MIIIIKIIVQFPMSVTPGFVPNQIDIALVGAGPHALTLVTHLLQKCKQRVFGLSQKL